MRSISLGEQDQKLESRKENWNFAVCPAHQCRFRGMLMMSTMWVMLMRTGRCISAQRLEVRDADGYGSGQKTKCTSLSSFHEKCRIWRLKHMLPASLDIPRSQCRRRGKRRRSKPRIGAEFVASCSSAQRIRKTWMHCGRVAARLCWKK